MKAGVGGKSIRKTALVVESLVKQMAPRELEFKVAELKIRRMKNCQRAENPTSASSLVPSLVLTSVTKLGVPLSCARFVSMLGSIMGLTASGEEENFIHSTR
ncbi:hypothetical protein Tco_0675591 [Tanacetum coccineum]